MDDMRDHISLAAAMQIGEVAELAGVTTRTVRHYHDLGVLPEPQRFSNGYRRYELRDLVLLLRACRLAEEGLTLEEIAEIIPDDADIPLADILADIDDDLVRRQEQLQRQRDFIAWLQATVSPDTELTLPMVHFSDPDPGGNVQGQAQRLPMPVEDG